jgi:hypothetical protein
MKTLSLLLICSIVLYSCSSGGSDGNNSGSLDTLKTTKSVSETEEGSTPESSQGKMKANPETVEGMLMIQQIIKNFWNTSEENRNYAALGQELSFQTDYIIKNCSMKGTDHDELHKVLHPILNRIKSIKNAASYEEADEHLKEIEKLTQKFFNRFEVEQKPA